MRNVLVGSRALSILTNGAFRVKESTDWDIISESEIPGSEWHDPNILCNRELADHYSTEITVEFNGHTLHVMSLTGLAIMKRSHLWRTVGFEKHIIHYQKWMLDAVTFNEDALDLIARRSQLHRLMFGDPRPSLNMSVDEFFNDAVVKKYDHDRIHELVAFGDRPLYESLQRDSSRAWCEKDLWDDLPYELKLKCVAEETMVIAIERFMVPSGWKHSAKSAYNKALTKVCTNLTSGWFRDFAIDNHRELFIMCPESRIMSLKDVLP